jgi:streptomycin 6-kinase
MRHQPDGNELGLHISIPPRLAENCDKTAERAAWLRRLPAAIATLAKQWSLTLGPPYTAEVSCAWVAPVMRPDGDAGVLKLGMPHMEGEQELEGLRFWDGDPTVRVLSADDRTGGMLLERCEPGTALRLLPEPDQDVVISKLLRRLWRLPSQPHPFRHLSALMDSWAEETMAAARRWPDAGLVREGLALLRDLARTAPAEVLLATDLHAGNVLRSRREPWLVIDPKPFIGDPAYDATQHLLNCDARLKADGSEVIRRFADLLDVDAERVRLWTFARTAAEPWENWQDDELIELAKRLAP